MSEYKEYFNITLSIEKHRVKKGDKDIKVSNCSYRNSYVLTEEEIKTAVNSCLSWVDGVFLSNKRNNLFEKEFCNEEVI